MKKKLTLKELKVKSFQTKDAPTNAATVKGGLIVDGPIINPTINITQQISCAAICSCFGTCMEPICGGTTIPTTDQTATTDTSTIIVNPF